MTPAALVRGLAVTKRVARPGSDRTGVSEVPGIVFVHGAMDRGAAFAGVCRHLDTFTTVRYDRRGYGRSADAGVSGSIDDQVDDLLAVVDATVEGSVVVVGHSLGAVIALTAAARVGDRVSSVGAFEPPLPWLAWWPVPGPPPDGSPADVAERFMRRIVGDERWEGLPAGTRAQRRTEGAALIADLVAIRGEPPFEAAALERPVVLGRGGASDVRHVRAVDELSTMLPDAEVVVIDGATHDAHHRDAAGFARFVRRVVERATARA